MKVIHSPSVSKLTKSRNMMDKEERERIEMIQLAHNAAEKANHALISAQWNMAHPSRYSDEFDQRWERARRAVHELRQFTYYQTKGL